MAEIYDMTAHTSITNAVESCEPKQEVRQIINYSRTGTVYIQMTSLPTKTYEVVCHATRAQVTLLETAWASGNLLRVNVLNEERNADRVCYGRIIEFDKEFLGNLFNGIESKDYYKINFKMAYENYTPGGS